MARRGRRGSDTPLVIGYADFETTNQSDIEAETGCTVRLDGNEARLFDPEGNDRGIPAVRVKCAGLLVRYPDGSRNGCVVESVEELMEKLLEFGVDRCYFHNLRFDDSFIGCVLKDDGIELSDGWRVKTKKRLMNDMGMVYSDTLTFTGRKDPVSHRPRRHTCDIWDSAKIFPSKLADLGREFGVTKIGEHGEEAQRVGCDLRMKAYCLRDCRVLMTVMEYYFQKCAELTHGKRPYGWMTAASTSYHLCMDWCLVKYGMKLRDNMFPPCNEENGFPAWLREGYKGATPLLDPAVKGKLLRDLKVFDVNSMYPTQIKQSALPGGKPIPIQGGIEELMRLKAEGKLWVAKVRMRADVKPGHRATYMLKRKGPDGEVACAHVNDFDGMYADQESYQVIDSVTMDLLERDYENIHIEVLEAVGFRAHINFIGGFVDEWYGIKQEASIHKDKCLKAFAKLILNSLYGKFGANPEHRSSYYEYEGDVIKVRDDPQVETDANPLYLPMALFITAYARDMISRTCNSFGFEHVAYTDTDSVHIHGMTNEECFEAIQRAGYRIHGSDLGCYDYESRWDEAVYVRNKGYFHFGELDPMTGEYKGGNEIKMAGANGFVGMESSEDVLGKELYGTQLGGCRVRGGTLLMERTTLIDLRMDAGMHTRKKVKGMSNTESRKEMKRREDAVFASFGVI